MNRLPAFSLALTLVLAGCHQTASTQADDKSDKQANVKDSARSTVSFRPQTGRLISSDEVPLLEQINRESTKVLAAALPGIVRVTATRQVDAQTNLLSKSLHFQFHFGPSATHDMQQTDPSYGAGVILRKDGYIVTNAHVVANTGEVEVQLHDKRAFPAKVIAYDTALDLAVLKVGATNLPVVPWGDSDKVLPGEQIFAIGNPFNQEGSVSRGIVSAVGRVLPGMAADETFFQTDAAINPGNSGGALINIHGEVIGLCTLIASTSGGNEGVGFAIPANLASRAIESLLKDAGTLHGYLGMRFPAAIDDGVSAVFHLGSKRGALLAGVVPGTPADKAGLQTGDFITQMDGRKIDGVFDLRLAVAHIPVGKEVAVDYIRDGATKSTTVTVTETPQDSSLAKSGSDKDGASAGRVAVEGDNVLVGLQVNDLNDKSRQLFLVDNVVTSGVVINSVQYSSPAELKGISRGDVIENASVNQGSTRQLTSAKDFADLANNLKPDQSVVLLVHHGKVSSFIYLSPSK